MNTDAATTLKRNLLVSFTLPSLVLGIMHGPEGQIQAIYAKHAGIALTALAAATLFSKMFDAISYPLIGYLSDRTFSRSGTRKAWVIAGAIFSVAGIWNLLRPTQGVGVFYFGASLAATYLGWKLMEIPLQAWSYGLSLNYSQRARVQAWRALSTVAGQLLFFAIPYLAFKLSLTDSTELNFNSLGLSAIVCALALPLATLIAVMRVPEGPAVPATAKNRAGIVEAWRAVSQNPPLLRLLAAALPVNLFGGMMGGVAYLYIDSYLHLGKQFPAIMALAMMAGLAAIPFWSVMASRFERHRVWAVSLISCGIACLAYSWITPGPLAVLATFLLYPVMVFAFSGAVIIYIMSADIVDYGRLHQGEDHAGLTAIFTFAQKSVTGVSSAAGLAIAGFSGFDASAASQSMGGIAGIKLTGALLPALGMFVAAAIIWTYPLTRKRVAQIQAELGLI